MLSLFKPKIKKQKKSKYIKEKLRFIRLYRFYINKTVKFLSDRYMQRFWIVFGMKYDKNMYNDLIGLKSYLIKLETKW